MTTMRNGIFVCAVCGGTSRQRMLTSTNSFGSPDMDMRPAGMARATLGLQIQVCPHCGYAAGSITRKAQIDKEWLKSEEYTGCRGVSLKSDLAKAYFRRSMIAEKQADAESRLGSIRAAAWACDDALDREGAVVCRKLAVEAVNALIAAQRENEALLVLKADLMRRAEMFDQLLEQYRAVKLNDEMLRTLVEFESKNAQDRDVGCYTVMQARNGE